MFSAAATQTHLNVKVAWYVNKAVYSVFLSVKFAHVENWIPGPCLWIQKDFQGWGSGVTSFTVLKRLPAKHKNSLNIVALSFER